MKYILQHIKEKILLLVLLVISIGLYSWVEATWKTCAELGCSHSLIDNYLSTIEPGSMYLIKYLIVLLFLPAHYFKYWFRYIFSWGFPLAVYLTSITTGSSSIPAYGKDDVARFWGMAFAVISILFILYHFYKTQKQK